MSPRKPFAPKLHVALAYPVHAQLSYVIKMLHNMGLFSFRVKKHFMSYYRSTSNVLLTEKKENRQIALVHKAAENFEVGCKYYVNDIIAYYVSFFFFLLETNLEILFQKHFNPFNKKQGKGTKRKYSSMCRVSVMPYNRDISSLTLNKLPFIFWNGA